VPLGTNRRKLEEEFSSFGAVKKSYVLQGREGADTTIGFVTFRAASDAIEVSKMDDIQIQDNTLHLTLAPNTKVAKGTNNRIPNSRKGENSSQNTAASSQNTAVSGQNTAAKEEKKQQNNKNSRKGRLIIRNLSFKANNASLRKHFGEFGELVETNILKKNGKMVGCAFLQYKNKNHAAKAIKEVNGKEFLGRPVAVDWAVPKEVFKQDASKSEMKDEPEPMEEVKEELVDESEIKMDDSEIKIEDEIEPKPKKQKKAKKEIIKEEEIKEEEEESDFNGDDSDNESGVEGESEEEYKSDKPAGHDVDEHKTVFIKNMSFDSDEDDLRDMMEQVFGPVFFARIVMDKEMNHSKGTAFVKFKEVKDAEECVKIAAGSDGLYLDNRQLTVAFAIKKEDVTVAVAERKMKEAKDNRNLFLAREGLVREGSKASEGVSARDMSTRRFMLKQKKEILQNLHMFISTTRLVIRNFPVKMNDFQLKKMVMKYSPVNSKVLECRIMKDFKTKGEGTSKQYAFVNFGRHDDALAALRNINNNPEIFSPNNRPIVDFSIEDRKALTARARREEMSKLKNPTYIAKYGDKLGNPNIRPLGQGSIAAQSLPMLKKGDKEDSGKYTEEFGGAVANPKMKTLPKHLGDKSRERNKTLKISRNDMKKTQRDSKNPSKRKRMAAQKETNRLQNEKFIADNQVSTENPAKKMIREKKKLNKASRQDNLENKSFDGLVEKYKKSFSNEKVLKKWFD